MLGELSLPLRTPVPRFVGARIPWPFFGAELIPGRELPTPSVDRDALGRPLGEFLRALHSARRHASLLGPIRSAAPTWRCACR